MFWIIDLQFYGKVEEMAGNHWTKDQTKLAFYLYCQLPYGRIHSRNPEIIQLAAVLGRTPSALAMKMLNLASLDPVIKNSGRSGLGNASSLDRLVWDEFHADWELLATECSIIKQSVLGGVLAEASEKEIENEEDFFIQDDYTGETRKVFTEQRIKQHFFRRSVLGSYGGRCCMSEISDARLLVASHIVPWSKDKANRLNPSNGLCLSAIHDKAFDKGLISLTKELTVILSDQIKKQSSDFYKSAFLSIDGKEILMPEKFMPDANFVSYHRENIFLG